MDTDQPYNFSFTSSSMLLNETLKVAAYFHEGGTKEGAGPEAILKKGKTATSKREFREIARRLRELTPAELELLATGPLPTQKQAAFLAICKAYAFIRDFVIEVVRDKYLGFDFQIHEGDYRSFYKRKRELHPEMDKLSESSEKKVRQRTFTILAQAGIIDNARSRRIQPQIVAPELARAIREDQPEWLKIFLLSGRDIQASAG